MRERPGWRIGVDLGGTRIRVIALDGRDRRHELSGPSPGLAGLPAALRRRWPHGRRDVRALVVASRGVWTPGERRRHERRLRLLARRVRVISDVQAAYLGALGERDGVLLLAGTGSIALGRGRRGQWVRAGGWGPLLGDEGSAFWIGREWLRSTIRRHGVEAARPMLAAPEPAARIAALAPGVLRRARRGSRAARRVVARGHDALAALLAEVCRQLRLRPPVAVSWAGGLLDDAGFRAGVWRAARRAGLSLHPEAPRESPAAAACRLAQRLDAPRARAAGVQRRAPRHDRKPR